MVVRSNINIIIGTRLRRWRKNAGLSQNEVARRAHIPQSAISHWENGASTPGGENLLKLQNAFPAFDITWVVSGKRPSERDEESHRRLDTLIDLFTKQVTDEMASYGELNPDEIESLRKFLRVLKSGHKDISQLLKSEIDAANEIIESREEKSAKKGRAKKK